MLTLVRRQPQQPRARFAPRSPPRFARRAPASPAQARGSPFADALTACALCFAQVHRPLRRLPRTAGRDAPGTRAGAPAEPARTSPGTASRSALRTAGHSIAAAAPIRRIHRRRSPDLSYSANRLSDRPGRPWVPHPTQQAAGGAHAPSPRALRRPPPPLAAWLLLERAYVAPIYANYRGPDRAGRRMSYTDIRPQRDRTRRKHGPIHDRHTAYYGCRDAPAGVFHGRYTTEIVEFAPSRDIPCDRELGYALCLIAEAEARTGDRSAALRSIAEASRLANGNIEGSESNDIRSKIAAAQPPPATIRVPLQPPGVSRTDPRAMPCWPNSAKSSAGKTIPARQSRRPGRSHHPPSGPTLLPISPGIGCATATFPELPCRSPRPRPPPGPSWTGPVAPRLWSNWREFS